MITQYVFLMCVCYLDYSLWLKYATSHISVSGMSGTTKFTYNLYNFQKMLLNISYVLCAVLQILQYKFILQK